VGAVIFQLENGFNVKNGKLGQEGQEFGRQAFVGVSSATLGTVTLGRQYDSLVDYLASLTANGNRAGAMFSHPYDNDNSDNTFRINNAVKYASITYAGFSFGAAYAFSNSTTFAIKRAESVGVQYMNGGLTVAAAYLNVDSPNNGSAGAVASLLRIRTLRLPRQTASRSWLESAFVTNSEKRKLAWVRFT
jgi:predicted porin